MAPSDYNMVITKKFISKVQKHKCLYDVNAKKNLTSKDIDNIWHKIVGECRLESIAKAKRKWAYLASQYKKALQNPSKKSKYHDDLNFLYSFVQTIDDVDDDEVEFIMKQERIDNGYRDNSRENSRPRPMSSLSMSSNSRHLSNEIRPSTSSGRSSIFGDYDYPPVPPFSSSGAHIDNEDELRPFFESMYRSTKKLPLPYQRHVKAQFFEIISAAEASAANESTE